MRVYEFAQQHNTSSKKVIQLLQEHGYEVKSHMARIDDDAVTLLERSLTSSRAEATSDHASQRSDQTHASQSHQKQKASPQQPSHTETQQQRDTQDTPHEQEDSAIPEGGILVEPKTVGTLAYELGVNANQLILDLLKQGTAATVNQVLTADTVRKIITEHDFIPIEPQEVVQEEEDIVATLKKSQEEGEYQSRLPIVVVVGHVDHGKTTLLDHIRHTRVAAREKGGITQHLGAYRAETEHGDMVFLDTPGHEAFSIMRKRGVSVADIAILIVAADDGVMPQTVEAIQQAQKADIPIIVAINKVDKVDQSQLDKVYQDLARYNLVPEQWGGGTSCIAISAYYGNGISELLEVVNLQADILELSANMSVPATGYILESRLEKGIGPVATVMCHHGTLHVGDYFACGQLHGKVNSLRNAYGEQLKQVGPSEPVLVSGFPELPQAGDMFKVGTQRDVKKGMLDAHVQESRVKSPKEDAINLVIKVDSVSSRDALVDAIENLSKNMPQELHIVSAEVGAVTERDVVFANDIGARIYGLHTRVESKAAKLAQNSGVSVSIFNIIYRLLEDLEQVAHERQPVKMTTRKIGEATVLKVFSIKNVGVIAGARVNQGYISHDGYLVVWRGKQRVGEGPVQSLQHERKSVKEVRKGFECAFLVEGIEDWQEDDRVECYKEFTAS